MFNKKPQNFLSIYFSVKVLIYIYIYREKESDITSLHALLKNNFKKVKLHFCNKLTANNITVFKSVIFLFSTKITNGFQVMTVNK